VEREGNRAVGKEAGRETAREIKRIERCKPNMSSGIPRRPCIHDVPFKSITITACASISSARCASAPYTPVLTWDELYTTTLRHHNAAHGVMRLDG